MHASCFPSCCWLRVLSVLLPLAILLPFQALAGPVRDCNTDQPTATIDSGVIVGTTGSVPSSSVTVNKFLGIPFAAPPIPRFFPPKQPKKWSEPLKTTAKQAACIQQFSDPEDSRELKKRVYNYPPPAAGESEDCLYVNVYAPASAKIPKKKGDGKTVMMWFYGGNLQLGSNAVDMYDGTSFAANQDVIIVSANYRTNVFGFPNTPALPLEERNLGFLDQRLALDWVQRNIRAFGGDPDKVTIFGESAGSSSVDILITSMRKNPPFRAGIMQSGQTALYLNHNNNEHTDWTRLAGSLKCDKSKTELDCVREANATTIKKIEETLMLRFLPVADNVTMLEWPEETRAKGNIARVPIMVGTNADEGRYFVYNKTDTLSWLRGFRPDVSNDTWQKIIDEFPIGSPGINNSFEQLSRFFTEYVFQCPTGGVTNTSRLAGFPTWRYYFNATFPNNQPYENLGAFHSAEVTLVFGTYNTTDATEEQIRLSEYMQTAWANFAKMPSKGPGWKQSPKVAVLGEQGKTNVDDLDLDLRCPVFDLLAPTVGLAMGNILEVEESSVITVQQEL